MLTRVPHLLLGVLVLTSSACGQRRGATRRAAHETLEVECDPVKTFFDRYAYVDIASGSFSPLELDEIGESFKASYNALIKGLYCDVLFREISDVTEVAIVESFPSRTRLLLTIDAACRGCSEDVLLLSDTARRNLSPVERILKMGMGMDSSDSDSEDGSAPATPSCSCPLNHDGFVTPPQSVFSNVLQQELTKNSRLPADIKLVAAIEVEPFPCPEETEFESEVLVSMGSLEAAANVGDSDVLNVGEGFQLVYNDLQDSTCDPQGKRIASVEATITDSRRLALQNSGADRDLQVFNVAEFLVFIKIAIRGRCRFCHGFRPLFGNDAIDRRHLQDNQQSRQCFCAAGSGDEEGPPTTDKFGLAYNNYIEGERAAGRLTSIVNASDITQVDPFVPSSMPSLSPTIIEPQAVITGTEEPSVAPSISPTEMPSASPTSSPSEQPSPQPSATPSSSPTSSPSASPSASPSTSPSASPSSSPSAAPSSAPSAKISAKPSASPSTLPSEIPSAWPTNQPSSEPTANPTPSPSSMPSSGPSPSPSTSPMEDPTASPTSNFPSESPSIGLVCDPFEEVNVLLDWQNFDDGSVEGWTNAKFETSEPAFTPFLGVYGQGDAFPMRVMNIDENSVNRIFVSFTFYEIDGWDGNGKDGTDTLSLAIEGDGIEDIVEIGWFRGDYSEETMMGSSLTGLINFSVISDPINASPQGFNVNAPDQQHRVELEIPSMFFKVGRMAKLTVLWNLIGQVDEFVGIDDFIVIACVDVSPSSAPSDTPSISTVTPTPALTDSPTWSLLV